MLPFEKISGPETKDYSPISLSIWLQSIPGNQSTEDIKLRDHMSELSKQIQVSKLILQSEISAFPNLFFPPRPLAGNIVILKKNNIFGPPSPP